ncbi:MAG TPA: polysaccharide biosynthesis/export family protein, partial [Terriglobales bacterium]|nr:polysaccharide biosynthesis/export family protein [Terriglobales bacterium]
SVLAGTILGSSLIAQEKPVDSQKPSGSAAAEGQQTADFPSKNQGSSSTLRLGAGDLLEISVYNVPELSTKARVSSNGDVYLPLIDYVHVGDLSLEEAQAVVEKRLSDGGFVKNPHVTIFLNEYASQSVTVLGQVTRPGAYPILGDKRLYDIISAAGGLTDKAGKTVSISHRDKPDQPVKVTLAEGLAQTPESNVVIEPGDTIVVQRAGIVYVVGDVARPAGFLMDSDHLTVLQAVALAGGTNKTAKLNGAKIIRKTSEGMVETPVHLKKILQSKGPDMPLRADDILFVPNSAGKSAAYRAADVVVQAGTLSLVAIKP